MDKIKSNWNQQVELPGIVVVKFTIQRDGRLDRHHRRTVERHAVARSERAARRHGDAAARRAARGVSESHAHRPPELPVSTMKAHCPAHHWRSSPPSASRWARGRKPRRRSSRPTSAPRSAATPGTPPRFAVPPLHRPVVGRRDDGRREDHRRRAVGRPELRARVRVHPARCVRDDSRREIVRGRAVRSLARVERRRRHRRHGPEDSATAFRSRCACSTSRQKKQVFGKEYSGSSNARLYAHTISDDIHLQQRALRGVARTKLAFDSDRDGERMTGTVESRGVKEIYTADYDGENQRRVTTNRTLNINPAWSPDARSLAYTSYRRGPPSIFVSHIYDGTLDEVTKGAGRELAAGLVSRRHARRVHVDARRQLGNLRRQPRRLERAAADQQSGDRLDADMVAERHANRVHVGPIGLAADLPRRGRRPRRRAAADVRVVRGPADVVAGAVQRDRLRVAQRARLRHQDHRRRDAAP